MNFVFRACVLLLLEPETVEGLLARSTGTSPLRRREEHEDREILQNIVEPMFGASGDEHDAPGTHFAIFGPHANSCAAPNDIVDLILGVHRLLVLAAPREFVQATAHRGDPQELEICIATPSARLEEIRDFVSFHRMPRHRATSPWIKPRRRTRYD